MDSEERCREIYLATGGCANEFINREDLAMLEDIYRSLDNEDIKNAYIEYR